MLEEMTSANGVRDILELRISAVYVFTVVSKPCK